MEVISLSQPFSLFKRGKFVTQFLQTSLLFYFKIYVQQLFVLWKIFTPHKLKNLTRVHIREKQMSKFMFMLSAIYKNKSLKPPIWVTKIINWWFSGKIYLITEVKKKRIMRWVRIPKGASQTRPGSYTQRTLGVNYEYCKNRRSGEGMKYSNINTVLSLPCWCTRWGRGRVGTGGRSSWPAPGPRGSRPVPPPLSAATAAELSLPPSGKNRKLNFCLVWHSTVTPT